MASSRALYMAWVRTVSSAFGDQRPTWMPMGKIEEPTTKPSGSKPASPSSTYSDTDRSEVNTPASLAPTVLDSRPSAASGSHAPGSGLCGLEKSGISPPGVADMWPRAAYYRGALGQEYARPRN